MTVLAVFSLSRGGAAGVFANPAGQADDDGDEGGGEEYERGYDEGRMLGDGGGGSQEADGEVQVGGGGSHDVDLGEVVVEGVDICDEGVEDFESGEECFLVFDVCDSVEVDVAGCLDQDPHAMVRGGGEREGGLGDSVEAEDVVEEVAGVGRS